VSSFGAGAQAASFGGFGAGGSGAFGGGGGAGDAGAGGGDVPGRRVVKARRSLSKKGGR
jgi:hypothetical protein